MNALKDMLDDIAGEARSYEVTDRALRVVRRRRVAARLAPVAVAVLVAGGLTVAVQPWGGGAPALPADAVAWLPRQLTPASTPLPLPDNRGVGLASLAYKLAGRDEVRLRTVDGREYVVPEV